MLQDKIILATSTTQGACTWIPALITSTSKPPIAPPMFKLELRIAALFVALYFDQVHPNYRMRAPPPFQYPTYPSKANPIHPPRQAHTLLHARRPQASLRLALKASLLDIPDTALPPSPPPPPAKKVCVCVCVCVCTCVCVRVRVRVRVRACAHL